MVGVVGTAIGVQVVGGAGKRSATVPAKIATAGVPLDEQIRHYAFGHPGVEVDGDADWLHVVEAAAGLRLGRPHPLGG